VPALAFVILSCAAGDRDATGASSGTLRVGVAPNYPPVVYEVDGEIVGIEADLAQLVGRALGRKIVYRSYPFPELLDALDRGEIDVVMSGLSITPERSARVLFCDPIMQVGQLALIRTNDIARFGRIQAIRRYGARVGYARGTTGEQYVAENLGGATSFDFDTVDDGIRSLRAGRIDYFIHDAPTIWRLAGDPANRDLQGLYQPLTEESLAWAVRRGNTKLLMLLNTTLAHAKREGQVDPIIDHWIPVRVTVR
jgi:polar amino acid transport system substrate-binding protein